jgi:hypothetical protein
MMQSQLFSYDIELCSTFVLVLGCFATLVSVCSKLSQLVLHTYYGTYGFSSVAHVDVLFDTDHDSEDSDAVSECSGSSAITVLDRAEYTRTVVDGSNATSNEDYREPVISVNQDVPVKTYPPGFGARPKTFIPVYEPLTVPTVRCRYRQPDLPSPVVEADVTVALSSLPVAQDEEPAEQQHLQEESPLVVMPRENTIEPSMQTPPSHPNAESGNPDIPSPSDTVTPQAEPPEHAPEDSMDIPQTIEVQSEITQQPVQQWEQEIRGKHALPYAQPDARAHPWMPHRDPSRPVASAQGHRYRGKSTPLKYYLSQNDELAEQQLLDRHLRSTIMYERERMEQQVRDIRRAQCSMTLPYHWDTYEELQQLATESCHYPTNLEGERYTRDFANILEHLRTLPEPKFPEFPNLHLYKEITTKGFVDILNKLLENTRAIHLWNRHLLKRFAVLYQSQSAELRKHAELNAGLQEELLKQQRHHNSKIKAACNVYYEDILQRIQRAEDITLETQRQCQADIKQIFKAHDNAVKHHVTDIAELKQNFSDVATRVIDISTVQMQHAATLKQAPPTVVRQAEDSTGENPDVVDLFTDGDDFTPERSPQCTICDEPLSVQGGDASSVHTRSPRNSFASNARGSVEDQTTAASEQHHEFTTGAYEDTTVVHTTSSPSCSDWDTPEQPYSEQFYNRRAKSAVREREQTNRDRTTPSARNSRRQRSRSPTRRSKAQVSRHRGQSLGRPRLETTAAASYTQRQRRYSPDQLARDSYRKHFLKGVPKILQKADPLRGAIPAGAESDEEIVGARQKEKTSAIDLPPRRGDKQNFDNHRTYQRSAYSRNSRHNNRMQRLDRKHQTNRQYPRDTWN